MKMVNQHPQLPFFQLQEDPWHKNFMDAIPPSAYQTPPAITPKSLASMVTEVNMAALSNQSLSYSSSPSFPPLHEHVMGGLHTSQAAAHATSAGQICGSKLYGTSDDFAADDTAMQSYLSDLTYFLAGKVKPMPGIQIYKCCMCGNEFVSRYALGGHMSAHSKRKATAATVKGDLGTSKSAKCNNDNSNKKSKKNPSSSGTKKYFRSRK